MQHTDVSTKQALAECEATIQSSLYAIIQTFELLEKIEALGTERLLVGAALKRIRDEQLYKPDFRSFSAYLEVKWRGIHAGLTRRYAYHLMDAAGVWQSLAESCEHVFTTSGDPMPLPTNPAQMRPLAGLDPETAKTAWTHAVENNGADPTLLQVTQSVQAVQPSRLDFLDMNVEPPTPPEDKNEFHKQNPIMDNPPRLRRAWIEDEQLCGRDVVFFTCTAPFKLGNGTEVKKKRIPTAFPLWRVQKILESAGLIVSSKTDVDTLSNALEQARQEVGEEEEEISFKPDTDYLNATLDKFFGDESS